MEKILKRVLVTLFIFTASSYAFAGNSGVNDSTFDWNPVMDAIIEVESKGDPRAVSGNSCGVMQITPILVKECNNILKKLKRKKRFKLSDRFNVAKSKEMFILIQSQYNPQNSIEKAIRSWNGGPKYSIRGTQKYFNKVMKLLK